jgi:hypothetical protein
MAPYSGNHDMIVDHRSRNSVEAGHINREWNEQRNSDAVSADRSLGLPNRRNVHVVSPLDIQATPSGFR